MNVIPLLMLPAEISKGHDPFGFSLVQQFDVFVLLSLNRLHCLISVRFGHLSKWDDYERGRYTHFNSGRLVIRVVRVGNRVIHGYELGTG